MIAIHFSHRSPIEVDAPTVAEAVAKLHRQNHSLRGIQLDGQTLNHINLRGADLQNAVLHNVHLVGANLEKVSLRNAYLHNCNLAQANLAQTYLRNADLQGSRFTSASLQNASLQYAKAHNANFCCSNLSGVDLAGAHLSDAEFAECNLTNVIFLGTKINWKSHDLVAAILQNEAKGDPCKLEIPKLILKHRLWCWPNFLRQEHPEKEWALNTLAQYVTHDVAHLLPGELQYRL